MPVKQKSINNVKSSNQTCMTSYLRKQMTFVHGFERLLKTIISRHWYLHPGIWNSTFWSTLKRFCTDLKLWMLEAGRINIINSESYYYFSLAFWPSIYGKSFFCRPHDFNTRRERMAWQHESWWSENVAWILFYYSFFPKRCQRLQRFYWDDGLRLSRTIMELSIQMIDVLIIQKCHFGSST